MSEWHCQEPFGIDDGELDDTPKHEAFVLGYELALIHAKLDAPEAFSMLIHAANCDRAREAAKKRGREVRVTYMHDDASESWAELHAAEAAPAGEE